MSPIIYAAVWAATGILAAVLRPLLRHRRSAWVAPAGAGPVRLAVLGVRWIAASPGRAALATGRIAGLGAAALLAAAAFVPRAGPAVDTRTALAGGLLAGGISAELGLVPLGGWVAGAISAVRSVDLAPWVLLLAPAMLFSVGLLLPLQAPGTRTPLANTLFGLGLATALYNAVQAMRDRGTAYG